MKTIDQDNLRFKFRVWDKVDKIMICDHAEVGQGGGLSIRISDAYPCGFNVMTLMQCTGLKSKTGELIYEGDILSFVPVDSPKFNKPYKPFCVYWLAEKARFSEWSPVDNVEIIGNRFDNPELLGG